MIGRMCVCVFLFFFWGGGLIIVILRCFEYHTILGGGTGGSELPASRPLS